MGKSKQLNFFDRYLTLWILLCIVAGIACGKYVPGVIHALGKLEVAQVNLPVGILIWSRGGQAWHIDTLLSFETFNMPSLTP